MQFNTSNYKVLRVPRARTQIPFTYVLNGTPLTETDRNRYLGTHSSKDLKLNKPIVEITAKANRSLGVLKRNLKVSSSSLREKGYMGFVRPQLEYGSTTWHPRLGVENNVAYKVEMVQRRAAKWTLKRYHNTFSVTDMLEDLGWRTLEQKRADARLALLFLHLQQTHTSRSQRVPQTPNSKIPALSQLQLHSFIYQYLLPSSLILPKNNHSVKQSASVFL